MHRIAAFVLAFVIPLAGCGAADEQRPATLPPSPSSLFSMSVEDVPPGAVTCALLANALRDASLMDPGVVDEIAKSAVTADAPVFDAAERLAGAYAAAVAAEGAENEPDAVAAVSAAAADMSGVCADSGLQPSVG